MEHPVVVLRTRRTRQQINEFLLEFSKAECTVKEFCQLHQISPGTFHKWQSRFSGKTTHRPAKSAFAKVVVQSSSSMILFAEVNGIRIYQPVEASYLKDLLP